MKAIIASAPGGPAVLVNDRPRPQLPPTYILVRTHAVALNPADNLYLDFHMAAANQLLGCDYAGTVLEIGPAVRKDLKPGDRVCGAMPGGGDPSHPDNGTFAEVICAKGDLAVKIPESMSFEEASTIGVVLTTTGRCMYSKFNIPFPKIVDGKVENVGQGRIIFIYGGSTAMGTMLMQFAKLSGFQVWTVCGPKNFDLAKTYGADRVWDYHDSSITNKIRSEAVPLGAIKMCVDCISTQETADFCSALFSPGATYSALTPTPKFDRRDMTHVVTVGYSFLGEPWEQFGTKHELSWEDFESAVEFNRIAEQLFDSGQIRGHPTSVRAGLESYLDGVAELKRGEVSGQKIVLQV